MADDFRGIEAGRVQIGQTIRFEAPRIPTPGPFYSDGTIFVPGGQVQANPSTTTITSKVTEVREVGDVLWLMTESKVFAIRRPTEMVLYA